MNLSDFSTHDLEKEIAKRNESNIPVALENPDFTQLIIMCKDHINRLYGDGHPDDDDEHYIYETAMEAVYGSGVWEWVNKQLR